MTRSAEDTWGELVQAELGSAAGPATADSFRRVAAAYEQTGFADVALAVLRKVGNFGIEPGAVLPALLRGYRKQRQFAELNAAVQAGLGIQERDADLRRELALALSSLGQASPAAAEWATLIRHESMSETDWLGCARFVMTCADASALVQLMTVIGEREELRRCHLAGYCTVKHLMDQDMAAAQRIVHEVDPASIPDADILLDLAIHAWRLQDYAKAETAAALAANSSNAPSVCKSVLASIRAFAGDGSLLRKVSMPTAGEVGNWVLKLAAGVQQNTAAWGFLHRHGPDSFGARILDLTTEPDMAVEEEVDPVATFSILSKDLRPDPFHVLCNVDWACPHIMLQRKPNGEALHFFVEAHGHKDWLWEEVGPELCGAGNDHARAPRRQQSATWAEAMRELGDRAEDELCGMQ